MGDNFIDDRFITIKINDKNVKSLLDTGAKVSVLSERLAQKLGIVIEPLEQRRGNNFFNFR